MLTFTNEFVNLVMDGHSALRGATSVENQIGEQLMQLSTIHGGMTYKNLGVPGQVFDSMTTNIADVHAAFEPGKQNLLFVLEASNTAQGVATGAEVIAKGKAYIDAVKAVHPEWRVFIILCWPVQESANGFPPIGTNLRNNEFNDYVRADCSRLGAEGYVETCLPGMPLYCPPDEYTGSWNRFVGSGLYQDGTHLNSQGNAYPAGYLNAYLPTIPDVAPAGGQAAPAASGSGSGNILLGWL